LLISESTVLDIGCGSGQLVVELAKTAKNVVAIDFSQKMQVVLGEKYRI
jgi:2-polyprenyl-3-methyl-5-hydroxy-6-metoxy-1,4-benzoquinol methylase